MKNNLIATVLLGLAVSTAVSTGAFAQQSNAPQEPPPKAAKPTPPRLSFAERIKQYLIRVGGTVDESKSTPDMIVSNSANLRGGKVTIVVVNDHRRNLLGFYVYNYLVSGGQTISQAAFEMAYITMAAVARERKPEIRKMIGVSSEKEDKPPDVKKAVEEKPPVNREP